MAMTPEQNAAIAATWNNQSIPLEEKKRQMTQFGVGVQDIMGATGQGLDQVASSFSGSGDFGGLHFGSGGVLTGTDWGGQTKAGTDPMAAWNKYWGINQPAQAPTAPQNPNVTAGPGPVAQSPFAMVGSPTVVGPGPVVGPTPYTMAQGAAPTTTVGPAIPAGPAPITLASVGPTPQVPGAAPATPGTAGTTPPAIPATSVAGTAPGASTGSAPGVSADGVSAGAAGTTNTGGATPAVPQPTPQSSPVVLTPDSTTDMGPAQVAANLTAKSPLSGAGDYQTTVAGMTPGSSVVWGGSTLVKDPSGRVTVQAAPQAA